MAALKSSGSRREAWARRHFPWIAGTAVLAAVAAATMVRFSSKRGEVGSSAATSSPNQVRCTFLSPDKFTVLAGGRQEITAHFSRGSGHLSLTWSASGGTLLTTAGRSEPSKLGAHVDVDDFDDGTLDRGLWKWEVAKNAVIEETGGALRTLLDKGVDNRVVRLETSERIEGDFGAQITLRNVSAHGNRGTASLGFVTLDGREAHVQAVVWPGYAAIEANARESDGTWRASASAFYGGGPVTLRLVRIGNTFSSWFDRGSGPSPLGSYPDVSVAPGYLRLETWSLDTYPAVEAELDNFGAAQNTIVAWQAPNDAIPGTSYLIALARDCGATATIGKPSAIP